MIFSPSQNNQYQAAGEFINGEDLLGSFPDRLQTVEGRDEETGPRWWAYTNCETWIVQAEDLKLG